MRRASLVLSGVVLWLGLSIAGADPSAGPSPSPRLAALAARPAGAAAFWQQVAAEGTPLIEDIKDPKGWLLVSFVYRAKPDTKAVAVYNVPGGGVAGYAQLERIPGTDVFAWSTLADPAARFIYFFAPGDSFGPPGTQADFARRVPLFRPDALGKRPYGVRGSIVELPKAPAQPGLVPHAGTPAGEVVTYAVNSKALGGERPVAVYTPPGFAPTGAPYPLVVMFDGPYAVSMLGLSIVLDELIAARKLPPVVVLLVGNADRDKELPGNAAFADYVALDLVPWVRRTYHATSDPRRTVVAGISFGGIGAAYAAGRHPAVYGNVLSQSGSYWWSPDDADEAEQHPHDYATRPRLPLRFWMEVGTFESGAPKRATDQLGANRHMRDVLLARGYEVSYREYAGAHEYISWRGTIGDGLVALLAKPPVFAVKPPASPGSPGGIEVGPVKRSLLPAILRKAILEGGAATVAWLQQQSDPALISESEINDAGYALAELGHAKQALALFAWNAQRFPASGNLQDSLAEGYYLTGDRAKALATYRRALELDPKNDNAKHMIELLR